MLMICIISRYLGLFRDHIVPAILYQYTQVLPRPDLLNSKGRPLITKARLETVWTRLADRLSTVVADTSMITISPEYAGHFYDLYINGKENAKLMQDELGFPDKKDPRKWSVSELNNILRTHVV